MSELRDELRRINRRKQIIETVIIGTTAALIVGLVLAAMCVGLAGA
jgi:hypothetical protein